MSNTNKVPRAREFALKYLRECREEKVNPMDDYNLGMEFGKYASLHLEAMRDELINTQYGPTRESINYIANTYIKNNKL